jgi:hypothetical protein
MLRRLALAPVKVVDIGWRWVSLAAPAKALGVGEMLLVLSAFGLGASSSPAMAHTLPTNTVMNAFVKIEPKQADVVVRIPMDLLRGLPFARRGQNYDPAGSGPVIDLALQTLADGLVFEEGGVRVAPTNADARLSPSADRSFESYEAAVIHTGAAADPATRLPYDQSDLDVHFTYPIASPHSVFTIQSQVGADLGGATKLLVRYLPLEGASRAMIIPGGSDPVSLNPTWYQSAASFVELGIGHILSGIDHLLFLFCLVIPFRRVRGLFSVITAFTLAHSVTLFASAFHLAPKGGWFPPFVETAIAASILYMALENIVGPNLRRRWFITGMFGLVHGFGFADVLTEQLQFAGSYLLLSLFSFNVGIELGQMLVLAVMLPALVLARRFVADRTVVVVLSGIAACVAARWMWDRYQTLQQQEWPSFGDVLSLARWPVLLLLIVGTASMIAKWLRRRVASGSLAG